MIDEAIERAHSAVVGSAFSTFGTLANYLGVHRTFRGAPLSLRDAPYLAEPMTLLASAERMVFRKAVQIYVSEVLICHLLREVGWHGRIGAYVLPDDPIRDRFVKNRIDKLLMEIPEYRARLPGGAEGAEDGVDSVRAKRIGDGLALFLGARSGTNFVEFSADFAIVDEYDRCDSGNVALLPDRLSAAIRPQLVYVGNPTLPRVGICAEYDRSDRRVFHWKCGRCNEHQPIDFFANVVERDESGRWVPRDTVRAADPAAGDLRPVCRRCRRPFRRDVKGSCWVAERLEDGLPVGYALSRLDLLAQPLRGLVTKWHEAQGRPAALRAFYCSDLGRGYEPGGTAVTPEVLDALMARYPIDYVGGEEYQREIVSCGVDVGNVLNVQVSVVRGDTREVRWVGALRDFEQIDDVVERYGVGYLAIDQGPETRLARKLVDRLREKGISAWTVDVSGPPRAGTPEDEYAATKDVEKGSVRCNRTMLLDATLADMVERRLVLPQDVLSVPGWSDQMQASVRVWDEDREAYRWDEGGAPDHYRFADAYDRVAADVARSGGTYVSFSVDPAGGGERRRWRR